MFDFKYGDKVEINKDGAWICKGFIVKLTTVGAYVHGIVYGTATQDADEIHFNEWFPYECGRMRMIHCN